MDSADILAAVDIAEYIGQYVDLHPKGGELWGLSPFTNEKTPSFSVNREKRCWKDFSSGQGGNLFDFIMQYHKVSLPRAIEIGQKLVGDDAQTAALHHLDATKIAKKFIVQKKVERIANGSVFADDCMDQYEFRRDKLRLWEDEGISFDTMRQFGVRYSAIDDRIVYPIKNYDGDIVCICGRTCDPQYKAKGLRKYTYFSKIGTIDTIYGYSDHEKFVMASKELILFEGAKSVMKAHQWGIDNTGAILTSHLSENQLGFLTKVGNLCSIAMVFALDADVDITKDKRVMKLARFTKVEWIRNRDELLGEKDSPVDEGEDVFKVLYERRERVFAN